MANKTIPQLPEQTGKTDNDLLAIVDSGETATSKIKVSTLLSGVGGKFIDAGGVDNIVPDYYSETAINDVINYNFIAGGTGNAIGASSGSGYDANVILGGANNALRRGIRHTMIGGNGNDLFTQGSNGTDSVTIGGNANTDLGWKSATIASTTSSNNGRLNCAILGGTSNTISNGNNRGVIIGGTGNSVTARNDNAILGGQSNTNAARLATILGGASNNCANGSQRGSIVGGNGNTLSEALNSTVVGGNGGTVSLTWNSVNVAPYNNGIYHDQTHGQDEGFGLYNAPLSYIRQTAGSGTGAFKGGNCSIFNSWTCDIAGQSANETYFGTIIGSESSQITGGTTGTVLIGCSGRTGLNSHTTYVETLEAFTHVVLNDYSNLNFASDSAAATGGVPLGGIYHNSGDLKVRIS